jgi:peptidoglycan-N-acetylglucosamine deacetylase
MITEKVSLSLVVTLTALVISISVLVMVLLYGYIFLILTLVPVVVCSLYFILLITKSQNSKLNNISVMIHLPFIFFPMLIIPIILALMMEFLYALDTYVVLVSFGLALSYINTFVYLPVAIYERFLKRKRPMTLEKEYLSRSASYPLITIIVPAYNEESGIQRTIDSLIEADYPHKQIIVVDDGSTDQTYAIASTYVNKSSRSNAISVITKRNGGKSSALNYAIRFSKGEILVIVDADSIIEKKALKELVNEFKGCRNVVAVAGRIKVLNRQNILTNCVELELLVGIYLLRPLFNLLGVIMIVPGAIGAFSKKVIVQRGLYNKDTFTEDFDLTVKLLKSGGSVTAADSMSYTDVPVSVKGFYKQRMRWYRGNFQTLFKHVDVLMNARYTMLQKFGYPFTLMFSLITPSFDFVFTAIVVIGILIGRRTDIVIPFALFVLIQFFQAAIVLIMDKQESWRIILYTPVVITIYKQIVNFLIIKSLVDVIISRRKSRNHIK